MLWYYLHVPWNFPNLPRIPIYVSLLGLWSDMGQDEIYDRWLREPLEKHGAVIIWFAGRWNILVTRPEYLTDMFRNEDIYQKAGSQVKIPWSVIASLVGDNVINTHDNWKRFTNVMKPGMTKKTFATEPMLRKSRRLVDRLLAEQHDTHSGTEKPEGILVNSLIQKWAVDVMGELFLDYDFQVSSLSRLVPAFLSIDLVQCLDRPMVRIEELQTIIKRTLFKPLFFNFPNLDKYPYIFTSRKRAFAIMKEFEDALYKTVRTNPRKQIHNGQPGDKQVVHMLEEALDAGNINDTEFRSNIKITFLTAHENAQQLMNSAFWELGKNSVSLPLIP